MYEIIFFFEAGYIFSLIGTIILVTHVQRKKHVEGISFYTQLLFCVAQIIKIFYFPYTVLQDYWICWIEYILSSVLSLYLMYLFHKYKMLTLNKEDNFFDYRIILAISIVLALVSNYEKNEPFEWAQFVIRFSIITESIGLLPQLRLMKQEKFVPRFLSYYLIALTCSRFCRVFFWIFQIKENYNEDTYYTLVLSDLFYIALTCDFIYNFFKHRNDSLIPYNQFNLFNIYQNYSIFLNSI